MEAYLTFPGLQRTPPAPPAPPLRRLKMAAKRLLGPGPEAAVFVPALYLPPAQLSWVCVELTGKRLRLPQRLFVNARQVFPEQIFRQNDSMLLRCSPDAFFHWENVIAVDPACGAKNAFLHPGLGEADVVSGTWRRNAAQSAPGAAIELWGTDGRLLDAGVLEELKTAAVKQSPAQAAADSLLRWRIVDVHSPFAGTIYCAFDLEQRCHRLTSWLWTSGIAVKALAAETADSLSAGTNPADLEDCLLTARDALLRLQIKDGPNSGGFPVRWDVSPASPCGLIAWLAPNDAAMLASQGLIALHARLGDADCLEAARAVGQWVMRVGTRPDGLVHTGFDTLTNRWVTDWLYVDCAFVTTLFAELNRLQPSEQLVAWTRRFTEAFLAAFRQEDGLFRALIGNVRVDPGHLFTRGQGWVLDGLLAAHSVLGEERLLATALELARQLERAQAEDGAWWYSLYRPASGADAKSVPVIAYHTLRLYSLTGEAWLLDMADRALAWCHCSQTLASDPLAGGGIGSHTIEGAITGRKNASVMFSYSAAYFLLATRLRESFDERRAQGVI